MIVHPVALASSSTSLGMPLSVNTDVLDSAIRDVLQRTSQGLFLWVLVSAFVVALGCALEGPELLHEMWPKLFTCFARGSSVARIRKFTEAAIK